MKNWEQVKWCAPPSPLTPKISARNQKPKCRRLKDFYYSEMVRILSFIQMIKWLILRFEIFFPVYSVTTDGSRKTSAEIYTCQYCCRRVNNMQSLVQNSPYMELQPSQTGFRKRGKSVRQEYNKIYYIPRIKKMRLFLCIHLMYSKLISQWYI